MSLRKRCVSSFFVDGFSGVANVLNSRKGVGIQTRRLLNRRLMFLADPGQLGSGSRCEYPGRVLPTVLEEVRGGRRVDVGRKLHGPAVPKRQ